MTQANMDETVLGFQLRVAPQTMELWDARRRAMYLLREDIRFPLSVDTAVWPEASDPALLSALFSDFSADPNSAPNGLSAYTLRSFAVLSTPFHFNDTFLIGLSVMGKFARELQNQHRIQNLLPITDLISNNWVCLGHDVADRWLISGLFNCGYEAATKLSLSHQFAAYLNEYGLFTSAHIARSFALDCNTRVSEHKPFAVFGVWKHGSKGINGDQ